MQLRPANLAAILANDPIFQGLSASLAALPRPASAPLGTTAPTYITGTSARLAKANRAALAGMVERAKADGHPEIRKWVDPRTVKPVKFYEMPLNVPSPNNRDMIWLSERTSVRN